MQLPPDAVGFAIVMATLIGTAFGVKVLIWGTKPLRRLGRAADHSADDERIRELEDRLGQVAELLVDQRERLDDHDERLDFAERLLARGQADEPRPIEPPRESTPV